MGDLDRLLELACFNGKLMSLEHRDEYDSLKKEIQELIEKGESVLNSHDDVFELGERKYWDIKKFGNFFKVETRMEYDKEHCERIINLIIHAFNMNLDSDLEQQNKALTEQVKQLQEENKYGTDELIKVISERDQLKSKIEKIKPVLDKMIHFEKCLGIDKEWDFDNSIKQLKEILGDNNE